MDSSPPSSPPLPGPGPRRLRILLVEDHADTLAYLSSYLKSAGHSVDVARTAREALAMARAKTRDVLLCDITLPDGDGCSLLGELAEARPRHCVAMSGYGASTDLHRTREAGFSYHLTKPFLPDDLDALLAQV